MTAQLHCKTDEIPDALPELVAQLTKPLFQAFDFFTPTPQFVLLRCFADATEDPEKRKFVFRK